MYGLKKLPIGSEKVVPPIAPVIIAVNVIPICTVDKKSLTLSIKSKTSNALLFPSSAIFCILILLVDTTAISAREKSPLSTIKIIITKISIPIIIESISIKSLNNL